MKKDRAVRDHVLSLLTGEGAHVGFEAAIEGLPVAVRGTRPWGAVHSPWEVLEHLRIAQWDILEFSRNPGHVSPEFPNGYWPATPAPPDENAWDRSVKAFRADLRAMAALVDDERTDLLAGLEWDKAKTVLREALVLADHNAYHLGEMVLLKRLLS